ncbi:MAG: hypothetical protein AAGG48_18665 [Planctomycetota bacterium]
MKKFLLAAAMLLAAATTSNTASAQFPDNLGFFPYGFYQPYGARYGSSIRTPPYFATNPPVYYGARYARPYGMSPFASPPLVSASEGYRGRLRMQFEQPRVPTPAPLCNPYITPPMEAPQIEEVEAPAPTLGAVRFNPFVEQGDRIAKK